MGEKQMPPVMQEDIADLVKVAVAERYAGYSRRRQDSGEVMWIAPDDSDAHSMATLPQVVGTNFALCEMLDSFCSAANGNSQTPAGARLVWGMNLRTDGQYSVHLVECWAAEATPDGKPANKVIEGTIADDAGFAIALVLAAVSGADLDQMHRELFPHRYIQTNA